MSKTDYNRKTGCLASDSAYKSARDSEPQRRGLRAGTDALPPLAQSVKQRADADSGGQREERERPHLGQRDQEREKKQRGEERLR